MSTHEPPPQWEVVEVETVDGRQVVAEYESLKQRILDDQSHTSLDGKATIVRDSLVLGDVGDVVDKVRGGAVGWEENYLHQPCTRVDDDPWTYDRISVERTITVEGRAHGTASIIFSETTETLSDNTSRLVVAKMERYTEHTDNGLVTGVRFIKVTSPAGEVLEHYHHRAQGATPAT